MKTLVAIVSALALTVAAGCSKQEDAGPVERLGKQVDEAVQEAGEYTGEKMEEMGEAIEQAGEEMQK